MRHLIPTFFLLLSFALASCDSQQRSEVTPWGTQFGVDSIPQGDSFGLDDIVSNGEMIVLTMSGPDTYFDYHGRGMGLQYMLCEKFAQAIGVSLRVELCKDTTEIISRLKAGDGDIAAIQLPQSIKGLSFAGARVDTLKTAWAVQKGNEELVDALNQWFKPQMIAEVAQRERFLLSTKAIKRRVYSPMLDRAGGVISRFDHYFKYYASLARWDWRLMAAQCYQESTFDPNARSWAGACGLMQIMPGTAAHLGLEKSRLMEPEDNIAAAAKYIRELNGLFRDVPASERVSYVLASYNGGHYHVRDAMNLARKYGKNPNRWADVQEFILKLSSPTFYKDNVVKYGYLRGSETVDYVSKIHARWAQYRGVARGGGFSFPQTMPERSKRGNRWHI